MFWPMFAMVVLTFAVIAVNFVWRVNSVRSGQVKISHFRLFEGESPEHIRAGTRHYANLFELPVLFYVACLLALVVDLQSTIALVFAWGFVLARLAHALVHMGSNNVRRRMIAFWCGLLMLLGLWCLLGLRFLLT